MSRYEDCNDDACCIDCGRKRVSGRCFSCLEKLEEAEIRVARRLVAERAKQDAKEADKKEGQ